MAIRKYKSTSVAGGIFLRSELATHRSHIFLWRPLIHSLDFFPHVSTRPLGVGSRKDGSPIGTARDPQRKAPQGFDYLPRRRKTDV